MYSARISRETEYYDLIRYTCKFSRKVGWKECPMILRVKFKTTSDEVLVEQYGNDHVHEEELDADAQGCNFRWTNAMTECIMQCLKNEATAVTILRNLRDGNLVSRENGPTSQQLNNKIAYCRKLLHKSEQVITTGELRTKIKQHVAVPDDECEAYIAYYKIDDDDENLEPRFNIIWTSKKLLSRINDDLTQDDATYRY